MSVIQYFRIGENFGFPYDFYGLKSISTRGLDSVDLDDHVNSDAVVDLGLYIPRLAFDYQLLRDNPQLYTQRYYSELMEITSNAQKGLLPSYYFSNRSGNISRSSANSYQVNSFRPVELYRDDLISNSNNIKIRYSGNNDITLFTGLANSANIETGNGDDLIVGSFGMNALGFNDFGEYRGRITDRRNQRGAFGRVANIGGLRSSPGYLESSLEWLYRSDDYEGGDRYARFYFPQVSIGDLLRGSTIFTGSGSDTVLYNNGMREIYLEEGNDLALPTLDALSPSLRTGQSPLNSLRNYFNFTPSQDRKKYWRSPGPGGPLFSSIIQRIFFNPTSQGQQTGTIAKTNAALRIPTYRESTQIRLNGEDFVKDNYESTDSFFGRISQSGNTDLNSFGSPWGPSNAWGTENFPYRLEGMSAAGQRPQFGVPFRSLPESLEFESSFPHGYRSPDDRPVASIGGNKIFGGSGDDVLFGITEEPYSDFFEHQPALSLYSPKLGDQDYGKRRIQFLQTDLLGQEGSDTIIIGDPSSILSEVIGSQFKYNLWGDQDPDTIEQARRSQLYQELAQPDIFQFSASYNSRSVELVSAITTSYFQGLSADQQRVSLSELANDARIVGGALLATAEGISAFRDARRMATRKKALEQIQRVEKEESEGQKAPPSALENLRQVYNSTESLQKFLTTAGALGGPKAKIATTIISAGLNIFNTVRHFIRPETQARIQSTARAREAVSVNLLDPAPWDNTSRIVDFDPYDTIQFDFVVDARAEAANTWSNIRFNSRRNNDNIELDYTTRDDYRQFALLENLNNEDQRWYVYAFNNGQYRFVNWETDPTLMGTISSFNPNFGNGVDNQPLNRIDYQERRFYGYEVSKDDLRFVFDSTSLQNLYDINSPTRQNYLDAYQRASTSVTWGLDTRRFGFNWIQAIDTESVQNLVLDGERYSDSFSAEDITSDLISSDNSGLEYYSRSGNPILSQWRFLKQDLIIDSTLENLVSNVPDPRSFAIQEISDRATFGYDPNARENISVLSRLKQTSPIPLLGSQGTDNLLMAVNSNAVKQQNVVGWDQKDTLIGYNQSRLYGYGGDDLLIAYGKGNILKGGEGNNFYYLVSKSINGSQVESSDANQIILSEGENAVVYVSETFNPQDYSIASASEASLDIRILSAADDSKLQYTQLLQYRSVQDLNSHLQPFRPSGLSNPDLTRQHVYRLHNVTKDKTLYSSNQYEIDLLTGREWKNEGVIYYEPEEATADVYRFYIPSEDRHFYTALEQERDIIIGNQDTYSGWQYEGAAFSAYSTKDYPVDAVAVVRYLNTASSSHVYSTDSQEQTLLNQDANWINEGIAWYVDPIVAMESVI